MTAIKSTVATGADEFQHNRARYLVRIADLHQRRAAANEGGSAKARALHKSRGQLLPRERIAALIDPDDPDDPIARQFIPSAEERKVTF